MSHREDAVIVNAIVRQALSASEEVMGNNGLNAVLRLSNLESFIGNLPPDNLEPAIRTVEYARFNQAIENFYGRGGKGMLKRIGKASFRYAVNEQPALLGIAGTALKFLPQKQRIKFILNSMVNALKKSNEQVEAWVEEKDGKLAYIDASCAICHSRKSDKPICYLYLGSIGEAIEWATGKKYAVTETHCMAKGDPYCRFEIGEIL
jgi:predicted hydrocarbon binding protein